jgi:hypothetical protein
MASHYRLRETYPHLPVAIVTGVSSLDEATRGEIPTLRADISHKPLRIVKIQTIARLAFSDSSALLRPSSRCRAAFSPTTPAAPISGECGPQQPRGGGCGDGPNEEGRRCETQGRHLLKSGTTSMTTCVRGRYTTMDPAMYPRR